MQEIAESLEAEHNLALQSVNIPLTVKLMFIPSAQNALDTDDIL